MFIPRRGGRVKGPTPSSSPESGDGGKSIDPTTATAEDLSSLEADVAERAINLALDDDAPLPDADDCLYIALSAAGLTEIDPVTGAAATNPATTGTGTIADPMLVPFSGTGIFMPGPSHTFGVFYNRVGYGSNRWLPVDPGRPIQAAQGKLSLSILTAGGIVPSGLLVLQYYRRPAGISWARWGKRVKESAHGYAISPLPTSSSGGTIQPTKSTIYRYQFKAPADLLSPVTPPAGTISTDVFNEDGGGADMLVGPNVGDIAAGQYIVIPAGSNNVVSLPGSGAFEWQGDNPDIAVAQFLGT